MTTTDPQALAPDDEPVISNEKVSELIEEFESEATTRSHSGWWRWIVGIVCAGLAIYSLYWTQYSIPTVDYRASFLLIVLVLTFLLYPMRRNIGKQVKKGDIATAVVAVIGLVVLTIYAFNDFLPGLMKRPQTEVLLGILALALVSGATALIALGPILKPDYRQVRLEDILLAVLAVMSLSFLVANYKDALQRIINPTVLEVAMGGILIGLTLEATRRTTGATLPLVALFFLIYGVFGNSFPEPFDHRGYRIDRIIGQNYLTLEGLFGVPLDVASSFIVLFAIYGAVLEYSGAGKFFLDWSFAALGKSKSGSGPGRTVTAAGFLLGTVSGSGVSTTVTLGSLAWPMLKKAGYDKETSGGILSAAGIGAILSPPTLGAAAFLIAEYLNISYLDVLVMAIVPTILYYLSIFLMIEADSRRMGTHAVMAQTEPLLALTIKGGYHFTSLVAVAVLMAIGLTPFMAVFWAIVLAFLLSYLQKENRLSSLRAAGIGLAVTVVLAVMTLAAPTSPIVQALELNRPTIGPISATWFFWGMMTTALVAALTGLYRRFGKGVAGKLEPVLGMLEAGGKGVVSIAATTACAGIIVSVITLTGLGLKFAGLIVDLAGNSIFLTTLFAAIAIWVLGLAVPVTASYIIAAVVIVPALTKVGVPDFAAHMFIFYYAVLADVSPPTALAPSAAAALTGGKPFKTMMLAWKYCLPAFLVPFMFCLSPDGVGLLLKSDSVLVTAWTFVTSCLAVAALAVGFGGWMIKAANTLERVLAVLGGMALLAADVRLDAAGLTLLAIAVVLHLLRVRRTPAALAT
ncbi:MAG: TRAP transporter fused permease subunit [Thermoflexales bacterium]|nr:TRAP transporter fused permease subunit [Thermoflexales bacterium]